MRVFVTGASGWIGSAVVPELISAGHQVLGFARSDSSAAAITAAGSGVLRGDLDALDALRAGAASCDGVIHLAFIHDFTRFQDSIRADARAIETMGAALEGSGKPLVIASGTPALPGRVATERDEPAHSGPLAGRVANARAVLGMAAHGVRSSVVGLPRTVHGEGDRHGFIARLVAIARDKGVSCAPVPPGGGASASGIEAARGGRRGRADPRHRGGDRPPPERAGCFRPGRGLRLPGADLGCRPASI